MTTVVTVLGILALLVAPAPARAAQASGTEAAERLLADARYTEARALLDRMLAPGAGNAANAAAPGGAERARALLLRARLTSDPIAAESDYLAVILGYPTTRDAAEALLRVGQGALSRGEAQRAAGYLDRLARDYPTAPQRAAALLWLARAERAMGRAERACNALTRALDAAPGDPEIGALVRAESAGACPSVAAPTTPQSSAPARTAPPAAAPAPPTPAPEAARNDTGQRPVDAAATQTIQSGAFRAAAAAEALARELRGAGFDARIATIPGSALLRVRVGRFTSSAEAATHAARLRAAGFEAIVVDDARVEREP